MLARPFAGCYKFDHSQPVDRTETASLCVWQTAKRSGKEMDIRQKLPNTSSQVVLYAQYQFPQTLVVSSDLFFRNTLYGIFLPVFINYTDFFLLKLNWCLSGSFMIYA